MAEASPYARSSDWHERRSSRTVRLQFSALRQRGRQQLQEPLACLSHFHITPVPKNTKVGQANSLQELSCVICASRIPPSVTMSEATSCRIVIRSLFIGNCHVQATVEFLQLQRAEMTRPIIDGRHA
jgi:hypothetical protein